MELLKQSIAVTLKFGPFLDETDGKTAETTLTITQADVRLSVNGGDMAQKSESTSLTHDEIGYYNLLLNTTDTGTLGKLKVMVHESGALPVWKEYMVVPANVYDSLVLGTDQLDAQVTGIGANVITATAIDTDAITATKIAANAIGNSELAAGAISNITFASGAINDLAIDFTARRYLRSVKQGTADSGSTTTLVDADAGGIGDSTIDDHWIGNWVLFTSGQLDGQVRLITAFNQASNQITFAPAASAAVTVHTYEILPANAVDIGQWLRTTPLALAAQYVQTDVKRWSGTGVPAIVNGRLDSYVGEIATNALDADAIATDAITATKIAANAIGSSEFADGAITAGKFAADAITANSINAGAIGSSELANDAIGSLKIADGAITAAKFGTGAITAAALAADAITKIRSLVASSATSAGTTTTIIDTARTEATSNHWKGKWIVLTSGTALNINQVRLITAFTPGADTITFAPPLNAATASADTYEILPAGAVDLRLWNGTGPSGLISGAVNADISNIQAGAVDAAAIATDAIDADALSADAATEIASATLKLDLDQVEATMPLHSLGTAALKAVSRVVDDGGVLKVYRTDGSTLHLSQTITTNPSADPIDELAVGV